MTAPSVLSGIDQANQARNRLGLGSGEPIGDVLKLVRESGLVIFVQSAGAEAPDGMFAEYHGQAFAWINSSKPAVRVRFTLAHEYAHSVFHDPGLTVDEDVLRGDSPAEKRARVFAAEFLVPQAGVVSWLTRHSIDARSLTLSEVVRLGAYFGVSAETALYRLNNTGCITAKVTEQMKSTIELGEHKQLSAYLAYGGWEDTVNVMNRNESLMPPEMQEAAWRLFQNGLLSVERLAHLLRRDVEAVTANARRQGIAPQPPDDDRPDFFKLP